MLEPWIIEQIRRREEEQRRRNERPQLEIPASGPSDHWRRQEEEPDGNDNDRDRAPSDKDERDEDKPKRGVMIIDFGIG